MVIMARIQGRNIAETSPDKIPRTVIDAVRKAINILHSKDYVFGDLRKANVVVCDSGGMLIDFDWCDKEGKATYPLLNPDITWHRDASAGRLIRKEHDSYMLTLLEKDSE
ncbi:hypothetical protein BT96DRAFT_853031 [Gymnopus androsaceus JB14]|uniref:Protein kinase domain-containing protein n=1 Tax=Gymnopus androsaceus JB14 TaxID=1447944 RepID=A0A6A4I330_9AGAR|nr:hypothetical protein BT96DRAFT_853031 [Gymnopus androsaceus JB14]